MKTEIRQFIIEEHANACSECKAKIEDRYPDLFKSKIEVGKWYINEDNNILVCCTKLTEKQNYNLTFSGYGIRFKKWFNEENYFLRRRFKPATDEEVKDALIAEAKRRGFKNLGEISIKSIFYTLFLSSKVYPKGTFVTIKNNYEFTDLNLYLDGVLIFHDGKWATIIEEEEEEIISIKELREKIQIIKAELQSLKELL